MQTADRIAELLLRLFPLCSEVFELDILGLRNNQIHSKSAIGCFLGTNRENIGELLFPLPNPGGVIVEEVPAAVPVATQFLPDEVPAQHDADQFARTLSALRGAQNDVAGYVIRILDQAFGQVSQIAVGEGRDRAR